tara:strand:- start:694 stop:897 length:204 start_codon:yes stop_codon:yes gene_type:complete
MRNLFASRTIWGAVVAGTGLVLNTFFGDGTFVGAEQAKAIEGITTLAEVVGLVLVVWGRIKAKGPLE